MSRLAFRTNRSKSEPTIALINVVFLLLVFFLIAGTLNKAVDENIGLVEIPDAMESLPQDVLSIQEDGVMLMNGKKMELANIHIPVEGQKTLRIAPDQDLPAVEFIGLLADLKDKGFEEIIVIGKRVR